MITALQHLKVEDASFETLLNLIHIMNTIGEISVQAIPEAKLITSFIAHYSDKNPKVIEVVKRSMKGIENTFNRNTLAMLYLRNNQLNEAFNYIVKVSEGGGRVRGSSIELLIIHYTHLEQLDKVKYLLKLAHFLNYDIYPRTYSDVITKAIQLNDKLFCHEQLGTILDHTFIDNGTLVALAELLEDTISTGQMGKIHNIATAKGSFPPDLSGRLRRAMTENFALTCGFRSAWKHLSMTHQKGMLRVVDFPNLLDKFIVSGKEHKVHGYLTEMLRDRPPELKAFLMSLAITKSFHEEKIEILIRQLQKHPQFRRYLNEECIWQFAKGLRFFQDDCQIEGFLSVLLSSDLQIRTKKIVDYLADVVLNSSYWFKLFQVLELVTVPNYKLPDHCASRLRELCEKKNVNIDRVNKFL
jgi:hypothetical protein